jgi:hypothetical protein
MKNLEQQELFRLLLLYFDSIDLTKSGVLNKNKIAKLLKKRLNNLGFWKNRKRGNPSLDNFKR